MIVSEEYEFVYFAPKKTGSTSVRTILEEEYGATIWRDYPVLHFEDTDVSPDWRSEGPDWKHVCHMPERFAGYFKFATIRDPYTLEQSRYRHDMRHKYIDCDFETFVRRLENAQEMPTLFRKLHQEPDYEPLEGCVKFALDAVIRMEHIQEDFEKLPFYRPGLVLGHHHKSDRPPRPDYTRKALDIVRRSYQEDFEAFGYNPCGYNYRQIPVV